MQGIRRAEKKRQRVPYGRGRERERSTAKSTIDERDLE